MCSIGFHLAFGNEEAVGKKPLLLLEKEREKKAFLTTYITRMSLQKKLFIDLWQRNKRALKSMMLF